MKRKAQEKYITRSKTQIQNDKELWHSFSRELDDI